MKAGLKQIFRRKFESKAKKPEAGEGTSAPLASRAPRASKRSCSVVQNSDGKPRRASSRHLHEKDLGGARLPPLSS